MSMYIFKVQAQEKDPSGYYLVRWGSAQKLEIKANTKKEALQKAEAVLGDTPTTGYYWVMVIDKIQEI